MPLEPELLEYENTQFLVIGEALGDLGKAVEEQSKDQRDDKKEKPEEEMEKLEQEVSFSHRVSPTCANEYRTMSALSISRRMTRCSLIWV